MEVECDACPSVRQIVDREIYILFAYDLQNKKMYKVANRVLYLIEKFGLYTLISVFANSFEILCGNVQTNIRLEDVREILEFAVMKHSSEAGFYSVVSRFFESLSEFPEETFQDLAFYITFPMVIGALDSKHGAKALEYLKEKLMPELPKYKVHLPKTYSVLLPALGISSSLLPASLFEVEAKFEEREVVTESDEGVDIPIPDGDCLDYSVEVSVGDVMNDYDDNQLIDNAFVRTFLRNFSSISFGQYLVHLSLDKRQLMKCVTKEFVLEFVSDNIEKFIRELDIPETESLQKSGVALIFEVIEEVYKPNRIPLHCFLEPWDNPEAKFPLLSFIAQNESMFSFSKYGTCWGSSRFVKGVITYPRVCDVLSLFAKYATKHPDVALLSLLKVKSIAYITDRPCLFSTLCDCLEEGFFKMCRESKLLNQLWEANSKVMREMCYRYSMRKDYASIFAATPNQFIVNLLEAKDLTFATEMALFASWDGRFEFSEFVKSRKEMVHAIAPVIVLCVNGRSFRISDKALNQYFACVAECFEQLTLDSRRIILAAYNQVKIDRPSIQDFDFHFVLQKATDELRFEAARRFEMYMTGDIALHAISVMIKNVESTNHELFEYMIGVLLDEMKSLDSHTDADKEKVIQLLAELIKNRIMREEHRNCVFSFILSNVSSSFSLRMIEILLNDIGYFTYFASLLLESEELATNSPKLYKKLETIVETFTFQEFLEFAPEINMHKNVSRFKSVNSPVPRKAKALLTSISEPDQLVSTISKNLEHQDWFASCLLSSFLANPSSLDTILFVVGESSSEFYATFLYCCAYRMFKLVNSDSFGDKNGEVERRKLYLLGRLVGSLTVHVNRPKFLRYFELKKLLLYALSNGKLYGVVPFVCELLKQGSQYWSPPNPFTSGILFVLASIYVIPALKQYIRYHIDSLFSFFHLKVDQILLSSELFPDKTINNFDFLTQPFDLSLLFSENQIDRIVSYDQNLYFCFLSSCIQAKSLPVPTSVKMKILWSIFGMIKERSGFLSDIIVSTAKNLQIHNLHLVKAFVKQTGASLVSQQVFFDYEDIMQGLLGDIVDSSFLSEFINANSRLIHQFLGDVTATVSLRRIQQDITLDSELDSVTSSLSNQLAMLTISPQGLLQNEMSFHVTPSLYSHLLAVENVCMRELYRGHKTLIDVPSTSMLHLALRDVEIYDETTEIDILKSSLYTYFKCFDNSSSLLYCQCLAVMLDASFSMISESSKSELRSMVAILLHEMAVVPLMLYHLLLMHITCASDVDDVYSQVLNEGLRSQRQTDGIIIFLHCYLVQNPCFPPQQFIKTLSVIASIPLDCFPERSRSIELLRNLFFGMSLTYKRSEVKPPFDPLKDIVQSIEYFSQFQKFKNAVRQQNEQQIIASSKQCMRLPRDFFVVVFVRETATDIKNLLRCLRKVSENQQYLPNIFHALAFLIEGYSTLPKFDFTKYYKVLHLLLRQSDCISLLHILRPLRCPSFFLVWIELVTDRVFLASTLQTNDGWKKYLPLLCDYTAAIGYLVDSFEPNVFRICYQSYLRFILVLSHDFPDFVAAVAQKLVTLLPYTFLQLRNILLSVTPKSVIAISPLTPDLKIDHIPDVHQSCFQLCPTVVKSAIEKSLLKVVNNAGDLETLEVLINCEPVLIPDLINRACELTLERQEVEGQRIPFHHLPVYVIFYSVLLKAPDETALLYIDGFIDQLRYAARSTHFFAKLLIELFKMNITRNDGISVSELILTSLVRRVAIPPPHPWGLQVTLIELMSNKEIGFWDYPFVAQSEQTLMLLKSVYIALCH